MILEVPGRRRRRAESRTKVENILEQMIAGHNAVAQNNNVEGPAPAPAPARVEGPAHSSKTGDRITAAGLGHIKETVKHFDGYRGQGVEVGGMANLQEIQVAAGLDWNPVKVQAAGLGKTGEAIAIPGYYQLFKSGTRVPLPVPTVTESYKPHTNSQVLGMMQGFCDDTNMRLTRVGQMDGGSRIWAVASSDVKEDVVVGDTIAMQVVVSTGHGNGQATKISARALRLSCSNGAVISVSAGRVSIRHNAGLTAVRIANANGFVRSAAERFGLYVRQLRDLYETPATPVIMQLALAQYFLSDEEDWNSVLRRVAGEQAIAAQGDERRVGADVIERVLQAESSHRVVGRMFADLKNARLLNAVIDATANQVGAAQGSARKSLGHVHNGVTYYQTHLRGRSAESGFKAALDRDDAQGFAGMLETQYVPAIRQVMGQAQAAAPVARGWA